MKRALKYLASISLLFAITACGSGGSTGGSTTPPATTTTIEGTLLDMGDPLNPPGSGWLPVIPTALNDSAVAVGRSGGSAFYWDAKTPTVQMSWMPTHFDAGITYDGTATLPYATPVAIDNGGYVIGYSTTTNDPDDTKSRASAYDISTSSFIDLFFAGNPAATASKPVDITENGLIALTAQGLPAGFSDPSYPSLDPTSDTVQRAYIIDRDNVLGGGTYATYFPLFPSATGATTAVAVNREGWLVYTDGDGNGYWYKPSIGAGTIANVEGETWTPVDINSSATIDSTTGEPRPHIVGNNGDFGFFWEAGAAYTIGEAGGGPYTVVAINDNDQVLVNTPTEAYMWQLVNGAGVLTNVGDLGGGNTQGVDINNLGQITGWSATGDADPSGNAIVHAFIWSNGTIQDVGTHDYFYPYVFDEAYPYSQSVDINNAGDITGYSQSNTGNSRGFVRLVN